MDPQHQTLPFSFARSHDLNTREGRRQYGGGKFSRRRLDSRAVELHAGLGDARMEGSRVGEERM